MIMNFLFLTKKERQAKREKALLAELSDTLNSKRFFRGLRGITKLVSVPDSDRAIFRRIHFGR